MSSRSSCVHDCRHPLWGGTGTCHNGIGDTSAIICECDAGYATRDAWGNASCVPRVVLVSAYVFLASMSVLVGALVAWDMNRHRRLPLRYQISRKMVVRTRALLSSSVYFFGNFILGVVLAVRAGETGYTDLGIWHAQYLLILPSSMFGMTMMAEYWVQSLPSQVISPDSFTGLLRHASDNTSFFAVIGLASAAPIFTLGILAFFFDKWLIRVGDLVTAAAVICAVIVVLVVAVRTSAVINLAMHKGSASSREFYVKAKKNLWLQAAALCSSGAAAIAAITMKELISAGRNTPVLPFTAQNGTMLRRLYVLCQILCGHVVTVVFTVTTQHEAAGGRHASDPAILGCIRPTTSKAAPVISSAGPAVHDLLLHGRRNLPMKQQGKVVEATAKVQPDEKHEARRSRACHDTSGDDPAKAVPIKSGAGGKTGSQHNPRNSDTARILPAEQDLHVVGVGEESVAITDRKEWVLESAHTTVRGLTLPTSVPRSLLPSVSPSPGGRLRLSPIEKFEA